MPEENKAPEKMESKQEQPAQQPAAQSQNGGEEKKGMSTGAKVALWIGGCCLLIVILFVALFAFGAFKAKDVIDDNEQSIDEFFQDLEQEYQDELNSAVEDAQDTLDSSNTEDADDEEDASELDTDDPTTFEGVDDGSIVPTEDTL